MKKISVLILLIGLTESLIYIASNQPFWIVEKNKTNIIRNHDNTESAQSKKDIVTRFLYYVLNNRKIEKVDELFAEQYVGFYYNGHHIKTYNRNELKQVIRNAPLYKLKVQDIYVQNNEVIVTWDGGINKNGLPINHPSGGLDNVHTRGVAVFEIQNGKIVKSNFASYIL